jgi:protein-L-isoaspartate(D-aspartate) O-methyltransferase
MRENFDEARNSMVLGQLRPNGVQDERVLEAMATIPRETFVPKALRGVAYLDEDLVIAEGRCLVAPMVFARLLQAAEVSPTDVVLDIACGYGYSSAVLGWLAAAVVAVEQEPELVSRAADHLSELDIDNVAVIEGNLREGYPKQGPYDIIHISGGVEELPQSLLDQLAPTGRLVCVTGGEPQQGTLVRRIDDRFLSHPLFEAGSPRLREFDRAPSFDFYGAVA